MSSPVFGAMSGRQNQSGNMMQQFQRFMKEMKGQGINNPNDAINNLLQSGKVSQQQLNAVQQQAQQMQGMFKGFFK